ncbi:hypothetical protein GCM10010341_34630 [Streptomyces noursei]|nr:hypothetical protein GCM10010341_34630 [Streptomyces noursei]
MGMTLRMTLRVTSRGGVVGRECVQGRAAEGLKKGRERAAEGPGEVSSVPSISVKAQVRGIVSGGCHAEDMVIGLGRAGGGPDRS